ncbi:MAG: hypothetical protein IKR40_08375 [Treponema sp.]|nr:hypothetical protein [Treponema sp.]
MKKTVISLFAAVAISLSANAQSAAQDAAMEEIPQAAMTEEIQEAEQSINELELVTDSPISTETEEKATSQPQKKFNPDDYKLESLDDMEIGNWNGSQYPEYIDIPNVDTILPDVNPADSYILKRQEKSSLDSTDSKAKPSRSVSIAGNQYLDVFYPGKGWIYLGETANTTLLRYFGHSISTKDTMFTLRARGTGKAILHFYKIDPLDGTSIDDYLEVTISGTSDGNSHITAPSYAETVPGKKYSPAQTETAQATSETETQSAAQVEAPAEESTGIAASTTETKPIATEVTGSETATKTETETAAETTSKPVAETEQAQPIAKEESARPAPASSSSTKPATNTSNAPKTSSSTATSTAPQTSSNTSGSSSSSARTSQSSAPKTSTGTSSSGTASSSSSRSGASGTKPASSSSSTQRSSTTTSTSSSTTSSTRTSSSTSSSSASSSTSRPSSTASTYSETPDTSTAQTPSSSPATSPAPAPKSTSSSSKGQAKSSGSSVIGSSADDELLEKAQKAYSAKKYGECLEYLTEFFNNAVTRLDEGLFLQGQALEAPSDYRNIKAALETYETLVKQYPKSKKWKAANERVIYLKRFYFNIR